MIGRDLDRALAEAERAGRRSEPWFELARLAERSGRAPQGLSAEAHLPRLAELWAAEPTRRELASLVLPVLGLALLDPVPPPEWWRRSPRLAETGGELHDRRSGFPLRALRVRDGAEMVLVPAGPFVCGSSDGLPTSRPAERRCLGGYLIDRYPVTVAAYARYREAVGARAPLAWETQDPRRNLPVTGLSMEDAKEYATWARGCLPTEDEWEKAARGDDGRAYPWGEEPPAPEHAQYRIRGEARTGEVSAVDAHPAGESPFGVRDCLGNVQEWCAGGILKGGHGGVPRADLAVFARQERAGDRRRRDSGFRVVVPLGPLGMATHEDMRDLGPIRDDELPARARRAPGFSLETGGEGELFGLLGPWARELFRGLVPVAGTGRRGVRRRPPIRRR